MRSADWLKIRWKPRDYPLLPVAVAARGETSFRLARRLLQLEDESLGRFEGVAGKQLLLVQGPSELLPWVSGVQYLGIEATAPFVLFPTNYQPSLPPELLSRAFATKLGVSGSFAIVPEPLLVVPMRNARPLCRRTIVSWLEQP